MPPNLAKGVKRIDIHKMKEFDIHLYKNEKLIRQNNRKVFNFLLENTQKQGPEANDASLC